MIYTLQNNELTVKVNDFGAELDSIKRVNDEYDIEYLWQLNPKIWERKAPLLFPIIGRLKDEEYEYMGETFQIDIHGFARNMTFQTEQVNQEKVIFTLTHNEETLKCYPFMFQLKVIYCLKDHTIEKSHIIENMGESDLYYEVGGHEGYNLALFENEKMEDYYIQFYDMEKAYTYTADCDIMMNKEKKQVKLNKENQLFLAPDVFKDDALIIDDFKTHKVALKNCKNDRSMIVEFEDFKYLGIWTKPFRTNYICIEPWSSLPDCNYLDKDLTKKKDVIMLKKNQIDQLTYSMTII